MLLLDLVPYIWFLQLRKNGKTVKYNTSISEQDSLNPDPYSLNPDSDPGSAESGFWIRAVLYPDRNQSRSGYRSSYFIKCKRCTEKKFIEQQTKFFPSHTYGKDIQVNG